MTDDEFRPGDVLASRATSRGARYVRIGNPGWTHPDHIWVQDCDAAGFLLGSRGRWLLEQTLRTRYRSHYRPVSDPTGSIR